MSHSPQSDDRTIHGHSKTLRPPTTSGGGSVDPATSRPPTTTLQRDNSFRHAPALPPLATLAGEFGDTRGHSTSDLSTPWRLSGVRNILNPASEPQSFQAQPGSPPISNAGGRHHGVNPAPSASPHVRKRGEPQPQSPVESASQQGGRTGRKILTPRSPSLRAASLGTHRSSSVGGGLISRVPLPSGEGRVYTAEPGDSHDSAVPPLPPLATSSHGPLSGLQSRKLTSPATHATGAGNHFPPPGARVQHSESRPDSNRSPYTNAESVRSGFPPSHSLMAQSPASISNENQSNFAPTALGPVRSGLPYGQAEYQLHFETQQGPVVVPVNVDYQQASKSADEKRRRNAGASARFRARRKEKEREANSTISGLQQELQELMEEREFYLRERNFFRDLLLRSNPGPLPPRPHSPQARRPPAPGSSTSEHGSSVDYNRQEADLHGSQRRRTGEYQPSLTSQSPSTSYAPPYQPPTTSMPHSTPTAPSPYHEARPGYPGPPPPPTRLPQYDPLRRNISDRDWSTGR